MVVVIYFFIFLLFKVENETQTKAMKHFLIMQEKNKIFFCEYIWAFRLRSTTRYLSVTEMTLRLRSGYYCQNKITGFEDFQDCCGKFCADKKRFGYAQGTLKL